jgi:hypothetical protein
MRPEKTSSVELEEDEKLIVALCKPTITKWNLAENQIWN